MGVSVLAVCGHAAAVVCTECAEQQSLQARETVSSCCQMTIPDIVLIFHKNQL